MSLSEQQAKQAKPAKQASPATRAQGAKKAKAAEIVPNLKGANLILSEATEAKDVHPVTDHQIEATALPDNTAGIPATITPATPSLVPTDELPVLTPIDHDAKLKEATALVHTGVTKEELDGLINALHVDLQEFKYKSAAVAALAVIYALRHGDTKPANKLIQALGMKPGSNENTSPVRVVHLRDWLVKFGPFVWKESHVRDYTNGTMQGEVMALFLDVQDKRYQTMKAEWAADPLAFESSLMASPYYSFKKVKDWDGFNLAAEIAKLISKATKEAKAHAGHPQLKLDGLKDLKRIAAYADIAATPGLSVLAEETAEDEEPTE